MKKLFLLPIVLLLAACQPDHDRALSELQQTRELHYQAHINRDAQLLVDTFADDFRLIQDGRVLQPDRQASIEQFQTYFDSVTFRAWDDLEEPVIHISADGRTAHVIIVKHVHIVPRAGDGDGQETLYAWMETWQQRGGVWKITALASTQQS